MALLDLLLPQRCVACQESGPVLCATCRDALTPLEPPLCARCGAPTAWPVRRCRECSGRRLAFAEARAAVAYDETAKRLVAGWKEHGLRGLGVLAADLVAERLVRPSADVVVFVPADRDRALTRGHRPAERLAREVAARWQLPAAGLLSRARPAARQAGLSLADRRRNVRDAFLPAAAAPARVVLVDDVYTTGFDYSLSHSATPFCVSVEAS